jgi:preflagellin peptidase FlaK
MFSGERRIYTKDLRLYPDQYKKELGLYKRAGTVWISYAVPFIIPITAGLLTAIVLGDILFLVMRGVVGA